MGLGSNLGNRSRYLTKAIKILENNSNIWIQKKSSVIETKPYGYTNQPDFLNCVIEISTTLPAEELLHFCLQTENSLGRKRKEKWGARTIDIDILFYGKEVINSQSLTVPHADLPNREFVLRSLREISPEFVHPVLNKNMKTLWEQLISKMKKEKA